MKKNFTLILISLLSLTTYSQDSFTLIKESKTWNVLSVALIGGNSWDTTYSTLTYEFFGDTIIDSQTYLKLYVSKEENPTSWNLWCYMREDNNKKVYYHNGTDNEELMYDFSAQQGDTLILGLSSSTTSLIVDSIGEIEINGHDRKKYWLSNNDYSETWIDGIGSSKGICWSASTMIVGGWYRFLCLSDSANLTYSNPSYNSCYLITDINEIDNQLIQIYPNPAKKLIRINNIKNIEIESIIITNINGQTVKQFDNKATQLNISDISSGLYFLSILSKNGKIIKKVLIE